MLKNDYWLRKRNGSWELKYPIYKLVKESSDLQEREMTDLTVPQNKSKTDMYYETSDIGDIMSRLNMISSADLKRYKMDWTSSLDQWVLSGSLWPFAEINTTRKEYKLSVELIGDETDHEKTNRKYPINAVVDTTNWGFIIGELEILVETPEEVDAAVFEIEQIAKKLHLTLAEKGSGKLIDYLKKYRPCAYNIYVETRQPNKVPA